MQKTFGILLGMLGASVLAMAQSPTPEIDATSAGSAIALVAGALLIYRGRRK